MTHDTYGAFLAPILPILIEQLGITLFMAGMLDVIRKIPSLLNPFVGMVADKIRVSFFIILAPLITTLSMSFLGLAPNYIVLVILVFVSGLSSTLFHVPSPVLIKHYSGDQIGRGMSYYMLGGELARTLGPLIILSAVSLWGLEGTFKTAPLGMGASLLLFFQFRKVTIHKPSQKTGTKGAGKTFVTLLPLFLTIGGIIFFRSAMKSALTIYLPTYLTAKDQSIWIAGISLAVLQFSGAIGTFLAGPISDKLGRKKVLLITSIINPLLFLLFINSSGALLFPILILSGFFLFTSGPVILALIHDIDSEHGAFINGVYMTINFLVASIMTLFIGIMADNFGMQWTYQTAVYISVAAIPCVLLLKENEKT